MLPSLKNNRGFGVVESIVAMFILSLLSYALYSVFSPVEAKFQKDRMRNTMLALESAMLSLIEDPIALRLFRNSQPFEIAFGVGDLLVVNDASGAYQNFNLDGKKCGPFDGHCPIKVKANFSANKFTYQISSSDSSSSTDISSRPVGGEAMVDSSLTMFQNIGQINCDGSDGGSIGIPSGITATGGFVCSNVNLNTCNPGEIPKGMKVEKIGSRYDVSLKCVPMREFKCPALYVMNKIDLSNLDSEKTLTSSTLLNSDNKCIFFAEGRFPSSTFLGLSLTPPKKCPDTLVGNQSFSSISLGYSASDDTCFVSQPETGLQKVGIGP